MPPGLTCLRSSVPIFTGTREGFEVVVGNRSLQYHRYSNCQRPDASQRACDNNGDILCARHFYCTV